jgi:hypothetical protein
MAPDGYTEMMAFVMRRVLLATCASVALLGTARSAGAQTVDFTVFAGRAFPLYDERLTLRPSTPVLPGVDVSVSGSPVLKADGGPVFGGALTVELGIFGIEGRLDSTEVGLVFSGARYDFRGTAFPFEGLTAGIIVAPGRFDADRISLLSLNARIRTPGPIGVIVSGGLSYLPDIDISGSIPLGVDAPDLPPLPPLDAGLTLRATPGQSEHRFGVNGGAGLRIGGRVALTAEVRAFYFREYKLRFASADGLDLLDELLAEAAPVRFEPIFVNAQVGLAFRF